MYQTTFASLVGITGGIIFILCHKIMASVLVAWQNDNFNLKYGKRQQDMHAKGFLVLGIIFVVVGFLAAIGVVEQLWFVFITNNERECQGAMDKLTFASIVGIVGGIIAIIFNKSMAASLLVWQKDNFNPKFGKKEERLHTIWFVVVGVIMLAYGMLLLADIINQPYARKSLLCLLQGIENEHSC